MTAWIVLGTIALILFSISLVRVGGTVEYGKDGVEAKVKIGPVYLTVYPMKKKKKRKKENAKPKKEMGKEEPPTKPGGSMTQLKAYLPLIADAAGRFKRKVCVDRLYLDFIAAADDPAMAAMAYGYANVTVGMIWPIFEHNFKVKEHRIRTAVDFHTTAPTVYVYGAVSLTIGQAVALSARLAIKLLKISYTLKSEETSEKEAV